MSNLEQNLTWFQTVIDLEHKACLLESDPVLTRSWW